MRYPVAFTWTQAEIWDWAAKPGDGLRMQATPAGDGPQWPKAPPAWRPGHRVYNLSLLPARDVALTVGWDGPGLDLSATVPWGTPRAVPERLLRRTLAQATVGGGDQDLAEQVLADFMRSELLVKRSHTTYRWPYGDNSEANPILPSDARLAFDPQRLASLGDWRLELVSSGLSCFVHDPWEVKVNLPTRKVSDGEVDLVVNAGGFVRGPGVDRELTEAEQREATVERLRLWSAPTPTFNGLAMQVVWPDPWGPEHSILRGLGSDRWGGPGVW